MKWPLKKLKPGTSPNKKNFILGRDLIPYWISPSPKEILEVARILEAERKILTKSAAKDGTAATPFHAAKGLSVDSLVRVIISQTQTNEAALDTQATLKHAYQYKVGDRWYEGSMPNYHEMHLQSPTKLRDIMWKGGLYNIKGGPIKKALKAIHDKNVSLLKPGEVVPIGQEPGEKDFVPGLLSMEYVWEAYKKGGKQAVFDELLSFKQVAVKTATCLMSFNMGIPIFAVDTHVASMAKLLG